MLCAVIGVKPRGVSSTQMKGSFRIFLNSSSDEICDPPQSQQDKGPVVRPFVTSRQVALDKSIASARFSAAEMRSNCSSGTLLKGARQGPTLRPCMLMQALTPAGQL
jgi:hypothetical protein